jgi:hypothetical protein
MCVHLAAHGAQASQTLAALGPDLVGAVATAAVRDWLETQARVVEYWRDLLADTGAGEEIVAALDAHAAFLNGVARG